MAEDSMSESFADFVAKIAAGGCRVIWGGYPRDTTCFMIQAYLKGESVPSLVTTPARRYADNYKAEHIAGKHLCLGCEAKALMESANARRPGP